MCLFEFSVNLSHYVLKVGEKGERESNSTGAATKNLQSLTQENNPRANLKPSFKTDAPTNTSRATEQPSRHRTKQKEKEKKNQAQSTLEALQSSKS